MSGGGNSVASMGGPAQGGPVNPKASMLVDPYRGTAGPMGQTPQMTPPMGGAPMTAPQFGRGVSYGALPQGATAGQVVLGPNGQMGKWSAGGNFHPTMGPNALDAQTVAGGQRYDSSQWGGGRGLPGSRGGIDGGMGGAAITRGMNTGQPVQQPGPNRLDDQTVANGAYIGNTPWQQQLRQNLGQGGGKGAGGMDALMQLFSRLR
jgi:hypothetical protein